MQPARSIENLMFVAVCRDSRKGNSSDDKAFTSDKPFANGRALGPWQWLRSSGWGLRRLSEERLARDVTEIPYWSQDLVKNDWRLSTECACQN
jgi:hypothetical protein